MIDVAVLGRVGIDLYPNQLRTRLRDVRTYTRFVGGFAGNVATGLARLGLRPAIVSRVGNDPHGEFVRDFLSGFFILVEDQYGVGDRVTVSGSTGTVEEVSLRVTRLRALDGAVWFVPNGEIRRVANATMGWSRAMVDVLVPVEADLDRVLAVMGEEAQAVASDPQWADAIVEAPQVLGIESMSADGYTIRVTARTAALQNDPFGRALRARIGARLRREGIALAKPPVVAAPAPAGDPQSSSDG